MSISHIDPTIATRFETVRLEPASASGEQFRDHFQAAPTVQVKPADAPSDSTPPVAEEQEVARTDQSTNDTSHEQSEATPVEKEPANPSVVSEESEPTEQPTADQVTISAEATKKVAQKEQPSEIPTDALPAAVQVEPVGQVADSPVESEPIAKVESVEEVVVEATEQAPQEEADEELPTNDAETLAASPTAETDHVVVEAEVPASAVETSSIATEEVAPEELPDEAAVKPLANDAPTQQATSTQAASAEPVTTAQPTGEATQATNATEPTAEGKQAPEAATPEQLSAQVATDGTPVATGETGEPEADDPSDDRRRTSDRKGSRRLAGIATEGPGKSPVDRTQVAAAKQLTPAQVEQATVAELASALAEAGGAEPGEADASLEPVTAPKTESAATATPLERTQPGRFAEKLLAGGAIRRDAANEVKHVDPARFVQRVAGAFARAAQRDGEIRLRLSPPELGSVRLQIKIDDGAMTARVETENSAARGLLLENLPQLRERLAEQNIRIERFDVDLQQQTTGNGTGQSHEGHRQAADHSGGRGGRGEPAASLGQETGASREATSVVSDKQINIVV